MAQLYFRYSSTNAGKSIEIIKIAHNYFCAARGRTYANR